MELLDRSVAYISKTFREIRSGKISTLKKASLATSGAVVVVLLLGYLIANPAPSDSSRQADDTDTDNGSMAYVQCQDYVKEYLKAPSTAKFSGITETEVHWRKGNGHRYGVIGWVDSQNSFGAMLRTKYICKATDEWNGKWDFESLITNDGE